ncbi:DUF2628 domain-containing protein [Afifella sp. IM 167]|uniref:DUF2628 domain-containing protein n=1 Tax=Afifella sp. IM 167 TaxID=2033586 RepID=UPI001CCC8323|nr:DUF2628 domain-containing protein [Afifella sp. IM 167]MBZ8133554.1 hypothetical protein [Afifella sp. IM 167]
MFGMRHYTVHYPPAAGEAVDDARAAERAAFVKDGFNWPALFIPFLWLLFRRMWWVFLLYLVASAAIVGLDYVAGDTAATWVGIAFSLYFALEANNLRRWSLERGGWREVGAASGRNEEEAALRFFAGRAAEDEPSLGRPAPQPRTLSRGDSAPPPVPPRRADRDDPPVMGLFPEAGG